MEKLVVELAGFLRRHYPRAAEDRRPTLGITSELEIWQVASILVQAHGDCAVQEATMHLDGAIAQSNAEGETKWRQVMEVIPRLLAKETRGLSGPLQGPACQPRTRLIES